MTGSSATRRRIQALVSMSLLLMSACDSSTVAPTQSLASRDTSSSIQYAVATGANTVQNSGFETAGAANDPVNWSRNWWGSPTPTYTYPVAGHDSPRAARIRYFATSTGGARYQPDAVSVTPGATWEYSEW